MSRSVWPRVRLAGGAVVLVVVGWRVGTGPIMHGARLVDGRALASATGITVITTVCSAWRWTLVADGLGVGLPLRSAVAQYYRSQFLNSALPGGILGDVHRGVSHGREARDIGRGLRAVGWERCAGQLTQAAIAALVLASFASPVRSAVWLAIPVVLLAAGIAFATLRLPARWVQAARSDVRAGLLAQWPRIATASALVAAGHTVIFVVAARVAGVSASVWTMLPLATLILLAMTIPANVAGWGPREGAAAWLFGAAGLSADQGVAVATVYGVIAFTATLPGAVILVLDRRRPVARTSAVRSREEVVHA